jgi:hypothetical protein
VRPDDRAIDMPEELLSQAMKAPNVDEDALARILGDDRAAMILESIERKGADGSASIRELLEEAVGNVAGPAGKTLRSMFENLRRAAGDAIKAEREAMEAQAKADAAGGDGGGTFDPKIADEVWDDGGQSYITRMYNRQKINAQYDRFKGILVDYFDNARGRAEAVLARLEAKGDPADAQNIQDLREFTGLSRDDLAFTAQQVIGHITGVPEGRMMFDLPPAVRGPLKARTLRIPDELIEDFLERDISVINRFYARTMIPDIEMVRMFGSLDMQKAIAKIADEADQMAKGADEIASARIMKAKKDAIQDLMAMADRIRGTYMIPEDPTKFLPTAGRIVRNINYLRLLGGMTMSAIPDVFRGLMVHGVGTYFKDGVAPLIRDLGAVKLAGDEVKMAGTALDMVLDTRAMAIADIMDDFGRHSKFERALGAATDSFGLVSLMAPWNAAMKQWVGMMAMTKIIRAAQSVADGTVTKAMTRNLAASSIDEMHARIIADQFAKHGKIQGGVYLPNTAAWDVADPNVMNAMEALRGAIVRDADRIIVTPGQDKPLWTSTQVGKIVGQFKSFGMASVSRTILAGLQQRDAGVLSGALMMIGMGMVVEKLRSIVNEKEAPSNTAQWVATGIDRSGLTGYLYEVNHAAERMTQGAFGIAALTGKPVSRYASRNIADTVLGPTGGAIKDIADVVGAAANREQIKESDIRAMRRLLPYQNLFYISWLVRQLEESAAKALNAKPSPQPRR